MVTIVIMWASAVVACVVVVSAGLLRRWPLLALALLVAIPVVASAMDALRLGLGLLVLFYAAAGIEVCFIAATRPRRISLPADIDLSAFRIIQEAVTNVVRHAGTGHCRVTVDCREEELGIEVTDEGHGGAPPAEGPGERGGFGIDGMRERARLLGGELTAGPRAEGGFRVAARLPVPAAAL